MATAQAGLNLSGRIFFGGLCVGTFGLGCWQTQRFFEKVDLQEQRQRELLDDPTPLVVGDETPQGFRRRLLEGQFRHQDEILVGPRGPPPGALAVSGPASGRSEGGMSSGPVGYYVITPFVSAERTFLVNRGWIPRTFVEHNVGYERPTGTLKIVSVAGKGEKPRFFIPPHDYERRRFYWMDNETMESMTGIDTGKGQMMIQVRDGSTSEQYPAQPPAAAVGEFKTSHLVHAGYAFTWFGCSVAGIYMTRKLITRGRG